MQDFERVSRIARDVRAEIMKSGLSPARKTSLEKKLTAIIDLMAEEIAGDVPAPRASDADTERARSLYQREGEIEIDSRPLVSRADDSEGMYVQAWVWLPAEIR